MKHHEHRYQSNLVWTGAGKSGTQSYSSYTRDYEIKVDGKPTIKGSSDPAFLGDPERYNPEDMFLASISACHMLWFLHICSTKKIIVTAYHDNAEGIMHEMPDGSGQFQSVTLHPHATLVNPDDTEKAETAHVEANQKCFIANSLNFPVQHQAKFEISTD